MANDTTPPADKEPADTTDVETDETGASMATFGSSTAWAKLHLPELDGSGALSVRGEWLDDEPSAVEIGVSLEGAGELTLALDTEEARQFASKIKSAASYAEGEADA